MNVTNKTLWIVCCVVGEDRKDRCAWWKVPAHMLEMDGIF